MNSQPANRRRLKFHLTTPKWEADEWKENSGICREAPRPWWRDQCTIQKSTKVYDKTLNIISCVHSQLPCSLSCNARRANDTSCSWIEFHLLWQQLQKKEKKKMPTRCFQLSTHRVSQRIQSSSPWSFSSSFSCWRAPLILSSCCSQHDVSANSMQHLYLLCHISKVVERIRKCLKCSGLTMVNGLNLRSAAFFTRALESAMQQTIAKIRSCQKNANAVCEKSSLKWNNATSFFLRLQKRRKSLLLLAFDHKKKTLTRLCIFFGKTAGLMASWSVVRHDCLKKLERVLSLEPWSLLSCALQLSATACARVNLKMYFVFSRAATTISLPGLVDSSVDCLYLCSIRRHTS